MTREEANSYFKRHIDFYCVTGICREAEEMAIQALEQERSRLAQITQYRNDCEKLMQENEQLKKALEQEPTEKVIKMRRPTPEERESVDKYVKSISKTTGVDFWDLEHEPCEDTISRQTVLDMLENINAETEGVGFYYEHYVEYIKKLPPVKPQEPKWIPVSEGLPKEAYGCLVTVLDTNVITQEEFENILPYFVGYDGETWNDADGNICPFEVIAWMPLPESYKAESEEEDKKMKNEQMNFPKTWEEYEQEYGFNDSEEVYTNNSRLIPSFRVEQWLDHLSQPCDDAISRQAVIEIANSSKSNWIDNSVLFKRVNKLPSVTPQQKTGHCKDCKYFEYHSVAKVDGIPLIVAHEICSKWGYGCKTKEDGYCFLFEPQERSDKE